MKNIIKNLSYVTDLFFTPSVEKALAGFTKAVAKLDRAEAHHLAKHAIHMDVVNANLAAAAQASAVAKNAAAISSRVRSLIA